MRRLLMGCRNDESLPVPARVEDRVLPSNSAQPGADADAGDGVSRIGTGGTKGGTSEGHTSLSPRALATESEPAPLQ